MGVRAAAASTPVLTQAGQLGRDSTLVPTSAVPVLGPGGQLTLLVWTSSSLSIDLKEAQEVSVMKLGIVMGMALVKVTE